ncbi:rCG61549 [Rattus norvegicus]|uniref:RCG61549 n=1 Tax=Rattus norvegicus TaxID=10116 RepID=A6HBU2_RAT|nr:rCG61549 [Rattus norvegicus]
MAQGQRRVMGISQDNWHNCTRAAARESPTTRSRNMSGDSLLPALRLALARYIQSESQEAIRSTVPGDWMSETFPGPVVHNASNNELVHTKTPVKSCIVLIDSTPYRQVDQRKFKRNTTKEKRMPKSAVFWRSSSSRASFSPVLPQDRASVAEQIAMCSRARSGSSICGRSKPGEANKPSFIVLVIMKTKQNKTKPDIFLFPRC